MSNMSIAYRIFFLHHLTVLLTSKLWTDLDREEGLFIFRQKGGIRECTVKFVLNIKAIIIGLLLGCSYGYADISYPWLGEETIGLQKIRNRYEEKIQRKLWKEAWFLLPQESDLEKEEKSHESFYINGAYIPLKAWVQEQRLKLLSHPELDSLKAAFFKRLLETNLLLEDFAYWMKDEHKALEELKLRWKEEFYKSFSNLNNPSLEIQHLKNKEEEWRNTISHFSIPLKEASYFERVGSPDELAEYFNVVAEALFLTEQSCEMAIPFWEKGLVYLGQASLVNSFQEHIWKDLGWDLKSVRDKLSYCYQKVKEEPLNEVTSSHLQYKDDQFCAVQNNGQAQHCYQTELFLTAAYPLKLGNKLFLLGRRTHKLDDFYLFIFDVKTGKLLKKIFMVELSIKEYFSPFQILFLKGTLVVHNPFLEITVFIDPFSLEKLFSKREKYFEDEYAKRDTSQDIYFYLAALKHEESVIRSTACSALANIQNPLSIPYLEKALQEDKNIWVKNAAIAALGALKATSAISLIIPFVKNSLPNVRYIAVSALGRMESPLVIDPLISALKDADINVYWAARDTLRSLLQSTFFDSKDKEKINQGLKDFGQH